MVNKKNTEKKENITKKTDLGYAYTPAATSVISSFSWSHRLQRQLEARQARVAQVMRATLPHVTSRGTPLAQSIQIAQAKRETDMELETATATALELEFKKETDMDLSICDATTRNLHLKLDTEPESVAIDQSKKKAQAPRVSNSNSNTGGRSFPELDHHEYCVRLDEYVAVTKRIARSKKLWRQGGRQRFTDECAQKEALSRWIVNYTEERIREDHVREFYENEKERMDAIIDLLCDIPSQPRPPKPVQLQLQRPLRHTGDTSETEESALLIEGELSAYQSLYGWSAFGLIRS
jgi:hypothetical protein